MERTCYVLETSNCAERAPRFAAAALVMTYLPELGCIWSSFGGRRGTLLLIEQSQSTSF